MNVSRCGFAIVTAKLSVVPLMWIAAAPSVLDAVGGTSFPGLSTA